MKIKLLAASLVLFLFTTAVKAQNNIAPGFKAPDFSLEYAGGKGKKVSSEELINKKIMILHFWKFN